MRRLWLAGIMLLASSGAIQAQEEPRPEQMRKTYEDLLVQLKQAQDRKNELAAENDRLNTKITDLQKQLDASKAHQDDLDRAATHYAEQTFFLRANYAAWQAFIHRDPKLQARWEFYLQGTPPLPDNRTMLIDPEWPFSENG